MGLTPSVVRSPRVRVVTLLRQFFLDWVVMSARLGSATQRMKRAGLQCMVTALSAYPMLLAGPLVRLRSGRHRRRRLR